jgi:hypothetical protein
MRLFDDIYQGKPQRPREGDIFAYRLRGRYGFGRIIRTGVKGNWREPPIHSVVYFYRGLAEGKLDWPSLQRDNLLLPPQLLDADDWNYAYFEIVGRRPLLKEEVWPVHCFLEAGSKPERYFDEYARPLPVRSEPCGFTFITGSGALEVEIAYALGIVQSEDDWEALPKRPTRRLRGQSSKTPVGVHLELPHDELGALGIDYMEIEAPLAEACVRHKLGDWVETGADAEQRHIVFLVQPRKVRAFADLAQLHLRSLGIRRYRIYNEETDEELV